MNVIWILKRRWALKKKNFVAWSVAFCLITYVSAQLKTLAITIISCLGKVRKLELFIGMKGGALGLRLLKLVRWWWVGVEGAWEAVVMFHHDWEWECVMELLGLRMSRRDFAFSSVIGRSQVGHVRVMLGVEAWANKCGVHHRLLWLEFVSSNSSSDAPARFENLLFKEGWLYWICSRVSCISSIDIISKSSPGSKGRAKGGN